MLVREHGVNTFKHFMAYKSAIMVDDEILLNSFARALELGALCTVHAENGERSSSCRRRCSTHGITGPEGHAAVPPARGRGRGRQPRHRHRQCAGQRRSISSMSRCEQAARGDRAAPAPQGQRVFGEVLAGHLLIDESVYRHPTGDRRRLCDEPAVPRARITRRRCGRGLQAGNLQTTATDHCCFCAPQKAAGRDNFTKIPNGTGGIEDRMAVLWHHGVGTGRLTPNEFVADHLDQLRADLQHLPAQGHCPGRRRRRPRGVGPGGHPHDLRQDPPPERRLQHLRRHESEGRRPPHRRQGKLVWADGDLRTVRGAGRYIDRPCFPPVFKAIDLYNDLHKPVGVDREVATAVTP